MYYIINCTSKEHPNKAFCTNSTTERTLKYKLIICGLFHGGVSISDSSALMIGCLVDENWEGNGRKQLLPNQGTNPEFGWTEKNHEHGSQVFWQRFNLGTSQISHTCHHYTKLPFFLNFSCAQWTPNNIFKYIL